jgi:putative endonuclease
MRIRFWVLVSSVRKRPKPPDTRLGLSRLRTPSRRSEASLFNDVRPPATRRGRGERSHAYLIKQRERTDCPQLTDVPSDLRVNGARHAFLESIPPSKPERPQRSDTIIIACTRMTARMHFVYMVRCADGTLYTGYARDPERRTRVHNAGRGAKYTARRLPVSLVYSEVCASRSAALKREYEVKHLTRARKERLAHLPSNPTPLPQAPGSAAASR